MVFEPTSVTKSVKVVPALRKLASSTQLPLTPLLSVMLPNYAELKALHEATTSSDASAEIFSSLRVFEVIDSFGIGDKFRTDLKRKMPSWVTESGTVQMAIKLLPFVKVLVVKKDEEGLVVIGRIKVSGDGSGDLNEWVMSTGGVAAKHFPAPIIESIINVTGAGDTLGGTIISGLTNNFELENLCHWDHLIKISQRCALWRFAKYMISVPS